MASRVDDVVLDSLQPRVAFPGVQLRLPVALRGLEEKRPSVLEVICQVVTWTLHLLFIRKGIETVRKFQDWAGPTASRSATAFR